MVPEDSFLTQFLMTTHLSAAFNVNLLPRALGRPTIRHAPLYRLVSTFLVSGPFHALSSSKYFQVYLATFSWKDFG